MNRRLTVIGFDPALGGRGALTLRGQAALAGARVVLVERGIAAAAALLRDDCPAGVAWDALAVDPAGASIPPEVETAFAGGEAGHVVWLMAGDPLSRAVDWSAQLQRLAGASVALEVLPSAAAPVAAPRPLDGVRVLVTRPRHQAASTCRLLEERGASTICMPTIEIVEDPAAEPRLDAALARLASSDRARGFDYLVLTSANGVPPLARALARAGLDARIFAGVTVCAIGPGTARALEGIGLRADLMPDDHRAEGLVALLGQRKLAGARVLLPRAAVARELLPRELEARGAEVELIPVYRSELPPADQTRAGLEALGRGQVDVLSFTSASTADNFAAVVGADDPGRIAERPYAGALVLAIGPVTAEACERAGLTVDLMPERYTLTAMVDALQEHLERRARGGRRAELS